MKFVLIFVILIIIGVFNYNNLYAQPARPNDFIAPQENSSETLVPPPGASSEDFGAPIIPPDFNSQDNNFSPNAMIIAQDMELYNETEIKEYPLTDLPPEEIKAVFSILDSGNITKVLLNIPGNDIKEIQNILSEDEFNNIMNKVSIENQTQIKERIDNN